MGDELDLARVASSKKIQEPRHLRLLLFRRPRRRRRGLDQLRPRPIRVQPGAQSDVDGLLNASNVPPRERYT